MHESGSSGIRFADTRKNLPVGYAPSAWAKLAAPKQSEGGSPRQINHYRLRWSVWACRGEAYRGDGFAANNKL